MMASRAHILVVLFALASAETAFARTGTDPREARRSPDRASVDRALLRGAGCLMRDRDGPGFRDPYLAYVYPEENLPSPPGAPRLTYRNVDAAAILVSIGREMEGAGGLATMIREAETAIEGAAGALLGR